jgi:hypothetical protein
LYIVVLFLVSCRNSSNEKEFTKANEGLQYKFVSNGAGETPTQGQFLKLHVKQYYNDSLLNDTDSTMPQYQAYDSVQMSKESYKIFSKVRVGDSLVFKVPSDSAFKARKPAFVKGKGWLITYVKIEAILSELEAKADMEIERVRRDPNYKPERKDDN